MTAFIDAILAWHVLTPFPFNKTLTPSTTLKIKQIFAEAHQCPFTGAILCNDIKIYIQIHDLSYKNTLQLLNLLMTMS